MKTPHLVYAACLFLILGFQSLQAERRVALVIGNGRYQNGHMLENPANDADAMAKALAKLGFEVISGVDADHEAMDGLVGAFRRRAEGAAVQLFFYAGHGAEVGGVNYLIPVDARIEEEADVKHRTVPLDEVLDKMAATHGNLQIVILDCCRDNPFGRSWHRGGSAGLAVPAETPPGTVLVFATAPRQTANDGRGAHSPFTQALLEKINQPGVPIELLFKQVGGAVNVATNGGQRPWMNSSFYGSFAFAPGGEPSAPPPLTIPPPSRPAPKALQDLVSLTLPAVPPAMRPTTPPPTQPSKENSLTASLSAPFVNSLGMKFVPVPTTKVLFSRWETRVQDYEAFIGATGRSWDRPPFKQGPTHPAVRVSWTDANDFCAWLSEREQQAGTLPPGSRYRLPTDEEWSRAVGLGEEYGETPSLKDSAAPGYPWGDAWPPPRGAGNYDPSLRTDSYPFTAPVGSFAPNRYGLFDLGGNAYEWVADYFDQTHTTRTVRGGSWADGVEGVMSSLRFASKPDVHFKSYGFRCVLANPGRK